MFTCSATWTQSRLIFSYDTEETVFFVGDSSGEKDSVRQREKIPQAFKLEWRAIGGHKRLNKGARDWVVIVDATITEIAHPESVLHESKSPWRIELAV